MTNVSRWVYQHYMRSEDYPTMDLYARKVLREFIRRLPHKVRECILNGSPRLKFFTPRHESLLHGDDPDESACIIDEEKGRYFIKLSTRVTRGSTIKGGILDSQTPVDEMSLAIVAHEVAHAVLRHGPWRVEFERHKDDKMLKKVYEAQIKADVLAQAWGFKIKEWLEEECHKIAFDCGKKRLKGEPKESLKEFEGRINALEKRKPKKRP